MSDVKMPHTAVVTQQLAAGITPSQAYRWLSRWSTSAPKFLVPTGAQHTSSGQIKGQGIMPGAVFETTYTEQRITSTRSAMNRTSVKKWTFTVLEANQAQCTVRFTVDRKNITPGMTTINFGGDMQTNSLFQFSVGTNGITVLSLTTSVHITDPDPAGKGNKKPSTPCILFFPLCWPCLCMYCCCNPTSMAKGFAPNIQAGVEKNTTETVRLIHFALQAAQQDGSINGGNGGGVGVGMVVVTPQQQQNMFQVQIPPNANAGMMLTVQAPDGQQLQIQVPAGVAPGSMISVPFNPMVRHAEPVKVVHPVAPMEMNR
jgi:hypothetical protein